MYSEFDIAQTYFSSWNRTITWAIQCQKKYTFLGGTKINGFLCSEIHIDIENI